MTPEGKIKAKVKIRLRREFGEKLWLFMPVQRGMGLPALDFLMCVHGRFMAIETKKDRFTKPTDRQRATIQDIEHAGGRCFVVYDDETLATAVACIHLALKCYAPEN